MHAEAKAHTADGSLGKWQECSFLSESPTTKQIVPPTEYNLIGDYSAANVAAINCDWIKVTNVK